MSTPSEDQVTELLAAWSNGDPTALKRLMPLVYRELQRVAHRRLARENSGHTLQTTDLVNEVYLKLVNQEKVQWQSRAHFLAVAAQFMRRILVDYARSRRSAKRGGGAQKVPFEETMVATDEQAASVVALDEALTSLAEFDPRKSKIVELRFFGGLSVEETAAVLGVSPGTVKNDSAMALLWLNRKMDVSPKGTDP